MKKFLNWENGWEKDLSDLFIERSSSFIKNNEPIYHNHLINLITSFIDKKGGWDSYYQWLSEKQEPYSHYLFGGAPIEKRVMPEPIVALWIKSEEIKKDFTQLSKDAENNARAELGLPAIGEGWISETELFRAIQKNFKQTEVVQHGRPHFLGRQHYDIWMPQWKVAVEFHGRQHFEPIEFFGGIEAFNKTVELDNRKIQLSKENNIQLFIVTHGYELDILLQQIAATRTHVNSSLILNNG